MFVRCSKYRTPGIDSYMFQAGPVLRRRGAEEERRIHGIRGAPDGKNARFGPTIVMRRTREMLQRRDNGEGWRRKAYALLPSYARDARFVPKIVMRRTGGVWQRGGDMIYNVET